MEILIFKIRDTSFAFLKDSLTLKEHSNEVVIHATTRMNLKSMLNEKASHKRLHII